MPCGESCTGEGCGKGKPPPAGGGSQQIVKFCIPRDAFSIWCIFRAKKCLFGGHCKLNYKQEFSSKYHSDIHVTIIITIGIKIWPRISTSVISYVIDINSYFGDKKYPAQTLKVAGDLRRASGAIENPGFEHFKVVIT